jgi:flagellar biogenesis protein FliO
MVLGIVGIALEFFNGIDLFGQASSYLFQSIQLVLLIPLILFALWLLNRWISTPSKNETKKSGNLPMYIIVLVGADYAFRLIMTGGL